MPQSKISSFLDLEKRRAKKSKDKGVKSGFSKTFGSFITILPAWKTKKNYALMEINYQRFKLFEHKNIHLRKFIQELLKWFIYVNPDTFNNDMKEILKEIYEDKKRFKRLWNERLRVY